MGLNLKYWLLNIINSELLVDVCLKVNTTWHASLTTARRLCTSACSNQSLHYRKRRTNYNLLDLIWPRLTISQRPQNNFDSACTYWSTVRFYSILFDAVSHAMCNVDIRLSSRKETSRPRDVCVNAAALFYCLLQFYLLPDYKMCEW